MQATRSAIGRAAQAGWAARAAEVAGIFGVNDAFWRMSEWLFERGGSFDEATLRNLKPDFAALNIAVRGPRQGMIGVTAPADEGQPYDFVSRFFAPAMGIPEDPVTGSAHCTLIPYWSRRLGKISLLARQLSARGGELHCEDRGERVAIGGHTVLFLEGTIYI